MKRPRSAAAPTLPRVLISAAAALALGVAAVTVLDGFASDLLVRLLQALAIWGAGALALGSAAVLVMIRLGGWRQSEGEFEALVRRAERLAAEEDLEGDDDEGSNLDWDDDEAPEYGAGGGGDTPPANDGFAALVRSALDEMPLEFHRALEHVAIVVSDDGAERRAYGVYEGDTVARDHFHERIVIFRDTLVRDFGHDPALLRRQVARTIRHELAHHLGWDERGVRELGL